MRNREPHRCIGPYEFFVLKKVGATVWGSAEYFGLVLEPVLQEGDELLQEERGLGELQRFH